MIVDLLGSSTRFFQVEAADHKGTPGLSISARPLADRLIIGVSSVDYTRRALGIALIQASFMRQSRWLICGLRCRTRPLLHVALSSALLMSCDDSIIEQMTLKVRCLMRKSSPEAVNHCYASMRRGMNKH